MKGKVFVFDTNALISAALVKTSVSALALDKALVNGVLAVSEPVLMEFTEVIFRKKFDKYFRTEQERLDVVQEFERNAFHFEPTERITACADPKDNSFLELAWAVRANALITGDEMLLALNPFRGIPIVNASSFLNNFALK
jgi:putative PIN family toxin of toxin-antitoxin system